MKRGAPLWVGRDYDDSTPWATALWGLLIMGASLAYLALTLMTTGVP